MNKKLILFSLLALLALSGCDGSTGERHKGLLLAGTDRPQGWGCTVGQEYHCDPVTSGETEYPDTQALFAAFYETTGWYDVTEDGDTLTVREQPHAYPLTFVFHTINDEPYVMILSE